MRYMHDKQLLTSWGSIRHALCYGKHGTEPNNKPEVTWGEVSNDGQSREHVWTLPPTVGQRPSRFLCVKGKRGCGGQVAPPR
jgi:hypothetical protein